jgi:hypothetical protein
LLAKYRDYLLWSQTQEKSKIDEPRKVAMPPQHAVDNNGLTARLKTGAGTSEQLTKRWARRVFRPTDRFHHAPPLFAICYLLSVMRVMSQPPIERKSF